ncbi:unnamed protein product [Arabis nemorensis]|uniref:Neprosin PEP catalytic domain-containing protein n=1 Tax=Arabis nemorensis TaxID=586526 RepID=A0A565CDY1_9BRAS|nr:unnamed protein product [Arabis nemorensis]
MTSPLVLIFSLSLLCLHGKYLSITPQEPEFECVDIYNQPSLQDPRLRNHQIQPNLMYQEKDVLMDNYGTIGEHAAFIYKTEPVPWRGASAWVSVYQPKVTKDQASLVLLWLENGHNRQLNTIQFGLAPENHDVGCYNVLCKGFVQIHSRIFLGSPFKNISVVGGQQYNTRLAIYQFYLGYWPGQLLPYLTEGARNVRYGGFTVARNDNLEAYDIVSPPMGNENKPLDDEVNLKHTCYMHFVKHVTQDYRSVDIDSNKIGENADYVKCYDLNYLHYWGSRHRQTFTFGGPGGLCDV